MHHFDDRLQKLLIKYGLQPTQPTLNDAEETLVSHWNNIADGARVAVWGAGDHTTQVLMELVDLTSKNVVCIVDKNSTLHGKMIREIPVVAPPAINELNIETIVVSSFAFRKEIAEEVTRSYPGCQVVDLYEGARDNYRPFYDHRFYVLYKKLFDLRERLKVAFDPQARASVLKELIVHYLDIRDFQWAGKYIDVYIENCHEEAEKFKAFVAELEALLEELQRKTKSRRSADVGVFISDSLRGRDVFGENAAELMPFLSELMEKSIVFRNMYSTSTYTAASFKSFLNGKKVIDDDLLANRIIDIRESPLLQRLKDEGFVLRQYGGIRMCDDDSLDKPALIAKGMNARDKFEPISKRLWDYLCDLADSDQQPTFSLLHLMESHWPFPSGIQREYVPFDDHPGVNCYQWRKEGKLPVEKLCSLKDDALRYIDGQLRFYMDYLPEAMTVVIMGDHGHVIGEHDAFWSVFTWYDEVLHVPLIVYGSDLTPKRVDDLESLQDFCQIIYELIAHHQVPEIKRSYVEIQRDPIFDRKFYGDPDFVQELGEKFIQGFKVIRTEHEKYIRYDDGREEFVVLPDERENVIDRLEYRERVRVLKGYLGNRELTPKDH